MKRADFSDSGEFSSNSSELASQNESILIFKIQVTLALNILNLQIVLSKKTLLKKRISAIGKYRGGKNY